MNFETMSVGGGSTLTKEDPVEIRIARVGCRVEVILDGDTRIILEQEELLEPLLQTLLRGKV